MTKKSVPTKTSHEVDVQSYKKAFEQLKCDIQRTQIKASISVTTEIIMLYWRTGKLLSQMIENSGWGSKTIEKLSKDLSSSFPDVKGFSLRNLQYMRKFAESYPEANYAAVVAQIPWGHNLVLLDRLKDPQKRLWYAQQALNEGWSRSMLEDWIKSDLYLRKGKAITNFKNTLPTTQSSMATELLKDPYNFDFMTLSIAHREKELEQGLMDHLQRFLIELGEGFAFMGRQFPIDIEGEDHFIDLLFYHVRLRCYVVIELKATEFDPRDAGQMNFYLSAVDDLLRHPDDKASIGILLCKAKNKVKVEYALRNTKSPIGVASYETKILKSLPKNLKSRLPTVEEIEEELSIISLQKKTPITRKK